jgi:hypothetical protein
MKLQTGSRWVAVAVMLAAAVNVSGPTAAQGRDDVLPALLAEVRGLRAAMEQMASAGPRVQLFASRLQLQEARIGNMIRRLDTVRDRMGEAQQEISRFQAEEKQFQAALAEQKTGTAEERHEAEMGSVLLGGLRGKIATAKAALDRHVAEEAQLMADLTVEQGRWTAINQQLDELEKALVRR